MSRSVSELELESESEDESHRIGLPTVPTGSMTTGLCGVDSAFVDLTLFDRPDCGEETGSRVGGLSGFFFELREAPCFATAPPAWSTSKTNPFGDVSLPATADFPSVAKLACVRLEDGISGKIGTTIHLAMCRRSASR